MIYINLSELSDEELMDCYYIYCRERLPKKARIVAITHTSDNDSINCKYIKDDRMYIKKIQVKTKFKENE